MLLTYTQEKERFFYQIASLFLISFLFFLPLSSTLKSIALPGAIFPLLLVPSCRLQMLRLLQTAWGKVLVAFFAFIVLSSLWSTAPLNHKLLIIEKYSKLLYLPILLVGFSHKKTRDGAIYAFLSAMIITCFLSIAAYYGFLKHFFANPDDIFRNHIITSAMTILACGLALKLMLEVKKTSLKILYVGLIIVFSYQLLFINGARIGYINYFMVMGLWVFIYFPKKIAFSALLLIGILLGIGYEQSPNTHQRMVSILQELQDYQHHKKDTSLGFRLEFHHFAYELFKEKPILGYGIGGFSQQFFIKQPVPAWGKHLLEPHSQYWLLATEGGIIGLGLFLGLVWQLFRCSLRLSENKALALGTLLLFMIGNLSDSLLFYSGSGYLFLSFMAISLAEKLKWVHEDSLLVKQTSCAEVEQLT